MSPKLFFLSSLVILFVLSGCSENEEYRGKSITPQRLAEIEKTTGVTLPPGTEGLFYHWLNGRDPCMWAKLSILNTEKDVLLSNPIFASAKSATGDRNNLGHAFAWWNPDGLKHAVEAREDFGVGHTDVFFGEESGDRVLYICWFAY